MKNMDRPPNFNWEIRHGMRNKRWVAGIDEVGRGPIAGPVVAAAVVFAPLVLSSMPYFLGDVRDSKKLSAVVRGRLDCEIRAHAFVALGAVSVRGIERHNILRASLRAMGFAYARLCRILASAGVGRIGVCLIDGLHAPLLVPAPEVVVPIVRGDGKSLTIACASIVAKVARDRLMGRLHGRYPCYGWDRNRGYPVARHLEALGREGLSPHHRRTFAPCALLLERE